MEGTASFIGILGVFGFIASLIVLRAHFKQAFSLKQFSFAIIIRSIIRLAIGLLSGLLLSVFIRIFSGSVPLQLASAALLFIVGMLFSSLLYRKALNRIFESTFSQIKVLKGYALEAVLTLLFLLCYVLVLKFI